MSLIPALFHRWGTTGVTLAQGFALLPPTLVAFAEKGVGQTQILVTALVTVALWQVLFALVRKRGMSLDGVIAALIVAILIPTGLPLWQLVVALSLGFVLGELVFGGRGFGFLSPATVTLALLVFSFPQAELVPVSSTMAVATLPGLALLLLLGLVSWRIIVAFAIGLAALAAFQGHQMDPVLLGTAVVFGLTFLICDPTAAASTNPGRWVYGLLTGVLVVLFTAGDINLVSPAAIAFAALLGSVFAPLIDHLVVLANAAYRRRRLA